MPSRPAAAGDAAPARPVGVEPWARCVVHVLPLFAPWLLVLAGRPICLLAQRLPPVVHLVRAIRSSASDREHRSA